MSVSANKMSLESIKIELDGVDFNGVPKPGKFITTFPPSCKVNFQYYDEDNKPTEKSFDVTEHQARESLFLLWAIEGDISIQTHINNQTVKTRVDVLDAQDVIDVQTPIVILQENPKLASLAGFQAFLTFCNVEPESFKRYEKKGPNEPALKKLIREEKKVLQIDLVKSFTPEVLYKFICTSAFLLAPDAAKIGAEVFKDRIPSSDILKMNSDPEVMKRIVGENTIGPLQSLSSYDAAYNVPEDVDAAIDERFRKEAAIDRARQQLLGWSHDLDSTAYKLALDNAVRDAKLALSIAEDVHANRIKNLNLSIKYMKPEDFKWYKETHEGLIKTANDKLAAAQQELVRAEDARVKGLQERDLNVQRFKEIQRANRL
jgi:hypothetical protein